ncbi:hypothetical protein [Paenibacillus sp. Y412MC10]|uniref:hypothetical protein n=1 Tax=Geobacillus sp. (strain Y412MC10) TaxID=481743 RepID=UPI00119CB100|nr:hypothetical protein [Paenibacillus sp. Y412MC10]
MRKINRRSIILTFAVLVLITGTSVYASDVLPSLFPNVSPEDEALPQAVQDRLTQSWSQGREIILSSEGRAFGINSKDEDLSKWTFIDFAQFYDMISTFSMQKRSSFLEAYYSEERRANLDVGDYMSALLINPEKSRALVYWEKANGSYVVMDLKSKRNSKSWYVDGVEIFKVTGFKK